MGRTPPPPPKKKKKKMTRKGAIVDQNSTQREGNPFFYGQQCVFLIPNESPESLWHVCTIASSSVAASPPPPLPPPPPPTPPPPQERIAQRRVASFKIAPLSFCTQEIKRNEWHTATRGPNKSESACRATNYWPRPGRLCNGEKESTRIRNSR